ncbi:MAG: hypothetical protein R3Y38_03805 [Rikenellaceae bacterium]
MLHCVIKQINKVSNIEKITEKVRSIDGVYPDGRSASYSLYNVKD